MSTGLLFCYYHDMQDRQQFTQHTLKNGIHIFEHHMDVPFAQIHFIFPVGAVHSIAVNPGGAPGIAHVLEHMLFEQPYAGADTISLAAAIAQSGGDWNAWTRSFTTEISIALPTDDFAILLPCVIEHLFRPTFIEEKLAAEVAVITQESAQQKYFPGDTEFDLYQSVTWLPTTAGTREQFFGTKKSLATICTNQLETFHQVYKSTEVRVVVGGSCDIEQVTALCAEVDTADVSLAVEKTSLPLTLKPYHEVAFAELDSPVLVWGGVLENPTSETSSAVRFLVNYLTAGQFGHLNKWLREEKAWSYGVEAAVWHEQDRLNWKILMPVVDKSTAETVREELYERVLQGIADTAAVQQFVERSIKSELFSFQSLEERIATAAEEIATFGRVTTEKEYRDNIRRLADSQILHDVYQRFFVPDKSALFLAVSQ